MRELLIAFVAVAVVSSAHAQPVEHDATAVYALPFKSGKWVRVVMGYDDPRHHSGAQRFAIDFAVPIGTEVHAARDGIVVGTGAVPSDANDAPETTRGDYVWVRHRDGTVGFYLHLRRGGAAVSVGQAVKAGQLLGYSGCTGYCRAGLLHFHVSTPLQPRADSGSEAFKTFATVFKTANGVEFLEPNRSYLVP
jgi:murein DD-endopeptidase MepM/ murein hydrolase activator NlpD